MELLPSNEEERKLTQGIQEGKYKRIVLLSGAGISTAAGIPDYRSSGGWFAAFPAATFINRDVFNEHAPKMKELMGGCTPTAAHYLAVELWKRGLLVRCFTQNIDGLFQKAGLPDDMIVEAHGNLFKDTVVLYGDDLPKSFYNQVLTDLVDCDVAPDLVLVMGTTLQVAPFCCLPNLVPAECTRALVTKNISEALTNHFNTLKGGHTIKFGHRKVTSRSLWRTHKVKWKKQFLIDSDVQEFSRQCMLRSSTL